MWDDFSYGKRYAVRYRSLMFVYMKHDPGYGGRRAPMPSAGGRGRYAPFVWNGGYCFSQRISSPFPKQTLTH